MYEQFLFWEIFWEIATMTVVMLDQNDLNYIEEASQCTDMSLIHKPIKP